MPRRIRTDKSSDDQVIEIIGEVLHNRRNRRAYKDSKRPGILVRELKIKLGDPTSALPQFVSERVQNQIINDDHGVKERAKGNMKPNNWDQTDNPMKVTMWATTLTKKRYLQMTVNLSDSVIANAMEFKKGGHFARYIQERVQRHLKYKLGSCPDFWFCVEAYQKKVNMKTKRSKKAIIKACTKASNQRDRRAMGVDPQRPHLHGSIEIPDGIDKNTLICALEKAGGVKDYDVALLGPQVELRTPTDAWFWSSNYASSKAPHTVKVIKGPVFAANNNLRNESETLYDELRLLIIERMQYTTPTPPLLTPAQLRGAELDDRELKALSDAITRAKA